MKSPSSLAAVFAIVLAVICHAPESRADVVILAKASGGNVVLSFSGSINTTGLGAPLTSSSRGGVYPVNAYLEFGPVDLLADSTSLYLNSVVTGESVTNFGAGGFQVPSSANGSSFSVNNNSIKLPIGYASNSAITGSITFAGKTFSDLQINKANAPYVWKLTNGQKITLKFPDSVDDNTEEILLLEKKIRRLKREIRIAKENEDTALVRKLTKRLRYLKYKLSLLTA